MKSVTPNSMPAVEVIRNRIQICLFRNRMMERRVKYRNLRDVAAKKFLRRQNSLHVVRIMQWRQIDTTLDPLEDSIINQCRFLEQLPAVHDTVTDGMYLGRTLDLGNSRAFRCNEPEQVIQSRTHVPQRRCQSLSGLLAIADLNDRLATDPLNFPAQNAVVLKRFNLLEVGGNDLKLQAGTSGIKYQYVHCARLTFATALESRERSCSSFSYRSAQIFRQLRQIRGDHPHSNRRTQYSETCANGHDQ